MIRNKVLLSIVMLFVSICTFSQTETPTDTLPDPEKEQAMRKGIEVFNGTKFGKGRYKAHHPNDGKIK